MFGFPKIVVTKSDVSEKIVHNSSIGPCWHHIPHRPRSHQSNCRNNPFLNLLRIIWIQTPWMWIRVKHKMFLKYVFHCSFKYFFTPRKNFFGHVFVQNFLVSTSEEIEKWLHVTKTISLIRFLPRVSMVIIVSTPGVDRYCCFYPGCRPLLLFLPRVTTVIVVSTPGVDRSSY